MTDSLFVMLDLQGPPGPLLAASPNTLAELLPAELPVGQAISPSTPGDPGSPAQDGPELFTEGNNTVAGSSSGREITFPAGGVNLIVTSAESNINFSIPGLTAGQVLIIRNSAGSVGPVNIRTTVEGLIVTNLAAGAAHEYTVPSGFDGVVRVQTGGARLAPGCLVSCKVKDAIAAVPPTDPIPGDDVDLADAFVGAVGIEVEDWPPGLEPTDGVIAASQAPSVGSGDEYDCIVKATNAANGTTVLSRPMVITEPGAVSDPVIVATGGGAIVEGATLRMDATVVGYPAPTLEWEWGVDTNFGTLTEFFTAPVSASEIHGRVRIAGGSWVVAPPVSVASAETDAVPGPVDAGAWSLADAQAVGGDALTLTILANVTATPGVSSWEYSLNGGAWTAFASGAAGSDVTGAYTISGLTTGVEADVSVRAVNAEGAGPASGEKSATPTSSAAGGDLTADEWTVNSAVTNGTELLFAVDRIPAGATGLRLRAGAVEANADYLAPGIHKLGGLTNVTAYNCQVSTDGGSTWSDVKAATTTAETDTRIAVWSGGEKARQLSAQPSATGSNTIVAVTGGGDVERVRFSGSRYDREANGGRYFNFNSPVDAPGTGDWLLYDPLGSMDGLAPGRRENLTVSVGGASHTLIHFGDAGMTVYPFTPSVVGFDGDGDPVPFRFDRPKSVGRLPDGRPFVVGTVGFVHNGGDPVVISPDATKGYTVVSDRGATCCVVARPGIIPPLAATPTALGLSHAYVRRVGAYNFAGDGWNDSAAASGGSTGVTVRANFESLGIYWAHSGTNRVQVRFRKGTSGAWSPAQDLDYDSRTNTYALAVVRAKHRGTIHYLEPGTEYQIELKDGSTYRRVTATTRSYKPTKASAAIGVVDGNVTISRSGDTVTVSRAGLADLTIDTTGVDFAEIHSGRVRRGTISVASGTTNVIIRDVDVYGGGRDGILLGTGCSEIRVIGGRISGWGVLAGGATSWCLNHSNAIRLQTDCSAITAMGCFYGSPRYSANTLDERDDYTDRIHHQWGGHFFGAENTGMTNGQIIVTDCTGNVNGLRCFNDTISISGANHPSLSQSSGAGPDSHYDWNQINGASDDGFEMEGSTPNSGAKHNVFWNKTLRPGCQGPMYGPALASVKLGPFYLLRNLTLFDGAATSGNNMGAAYNIKINPHKIGDFSGGRLFFAHNTMLTIGAGYGRKAVGGITSGALTTPCEDFNSFYQGNDSSSGFSGFVLNKVIYDQQSLSAANAFDADFRPTGSAVRSPGTAVRLSNVNDGGPFYEATPSVGALRAE